MPHSAPTPVAPTRTGEVLYAIIGVLVGLAAGTALVLAWYALFEVFTLFGTQPTGAERTRANQMVLLAGAVAIAPPLVGLVLSVRRRSRGASRLFGSLLAAAGLFVIAELVLI